MRVIMREAIERMQPYHGMCYHSGFDFSVPFHGTYAPRNLFMICSVNYELTLCFPVSPVPLNLACYYSPFGHSLLLHTIRGQDLNLPLTALASNCYRHCPPLFITASHPAIKSIIPVATDSDVRAQRNTIGFSGSQSLDQQS